MVFFIKFGVRLGRLGPPLKMAKDPLKNPILGGKLGLFGPPQSLPNKIESKNGFTKF